MRDPNHQLSFVSSDRDVLMWHRQVLQNSEKQEETHHPDASRAERELKLQSQSTVHYIIRLKSRMEQDSS
jgi:hypothetical protein